MRYFVGLLAIVALILGVLLLIIRGFGGDDTPNKQHQLLQYAKTDTAMQMTIQGPINADQEHDGVRIVVDRYEARVEILRGYEERVSSAQSFANNEKAYATFLRSLQLMGYTRGNTDPKLKDERGYCPTGNRFIFEIAQGSRQVQRFWKSSCDEGNFGGKTRDIIELFEAQIPDYPSIIDDVEL